MAGVGKSQSLVSLRIALKDLPRLDIADKTDGYCKVYVAEQPPSGAKPAWTFIAKTEVVKDNQSPSFSTAISLPFKFEEVQMLKIEIWDFDNTTADDYIGEFETTGEC